METMVSMGNAVMVAFGSGMILGAAITVVCLLALDYIKDRKGQSAPKSS